MQKKRQRIIYLNLNIDIKVVIDLVKSRIEKATGVKKKGL